MAEEFWTYILDDGEIYDADFKTSKECLEAMDTAFGEQVRDDYDTLRHGAEFNCKGEIVRFRYNDDTGEREELYRQEVVVSYEHYSDREEHGTYR